MKKQINDLKTKEVKSKCSKRAWAIFSFFSSAKVKSKHFRPLATNLSLHATKNVKQ